MLFVSIYLSLFFLIHESSGQERSTPIIQKYATSSTSITISYQIVGGTGNIEKFIVNVLEFDTSNVKEHVLDVGGSRWTFDGLKPSTRYLLHPRVHTKDNKEALGRVLDVRTDASVPAQSPDKSNDDDGGLSAGQKAGIAVGVLVGIGAVVAAFMVGFICFKKKEVKVEYRASDNRNFVTDVDDEEIQIDIDKNKTASPVVQARKKLNFDSGQNSSPPEEIDITDLAAAPAGSRLSYVDADAAPRPRWGKGAVKLKEYRRQRSESDISEEDSPYARDGTRRPSHSFPVPAAQPIGQPLSVSNELVDDTKRGAYSNAKGLGKRLPSAYPPKKVPINAQPATSPRANVGVPESHFTNPQGHDSRPYSPRAASHVPTPVSSRVEATVHTSSSNARPSPSTHVGYQNERRYMSGHSAQHEATPTDARYPPGQSNYSQKSPRSVHHPGTPNYGKSPSGNTYQQPTPDSASYQTTPGNAGQPSALSDARYTTRGNVQHSSTPADTGNVRTDYRPAPSSNSKYHPSSPAHGPTVSRYRSEPRPIDTQRSQHRSPNDFHVSRHHDNGKQNVRYNQPPRLQASVPSNSHLPQHNKPEPPIRGVPRPPAQSPGYTADFSAVSNRPDPHRARSIQQSPAVSANAYGAHNNSAYSSSGDEHYSRITNRYGGDVDESAI